jgi:hypothetical protein
MFRAVYLDLTYFIVSQPRGAEKQIWFLTYGSSFQSITHEVLLDCGLEVDECYTATWRESKYTLFHLQRKHRLRRSAMDKILQQIHYRFNIVPTEIFGFDSVSSNSRSNGELMDHPGFRIMVEQVNREPLGLEWWISCGAAELSANRKGLLWKYIESTDARSMTHAQLVTRVQKWAPMVSELERLKNMNAMLGEHNAALIDRKPLPSTHTILTKYRVYKPLRDVMKIVGKLSKKLNETPSHDGSGEIYAAVNPMMQHLYKMGFTFKDAETRVKALQTAGVLEPFELIRCVKVADAR